MKNLQNSQIKILGIIVVLVIVFGIYASKSKTTSTSEQNIASSTTPTTNTTKTTSTNTSQPKTTSASLSGKCNFHIIYPTAGSRVSFPLTIKGIIDYPNPQKTGCLWNEIARNAGTAQLFYNLNNYGWRSQGTAVNIMTTAVGSTTDFSATLNFLNQGVGLPSGSLMKITFIENSFDNPNPDTFDFYVYLK
jgi:hypothetical protein